jgi:hypothetical protein
MKLHITKYGYLAHRYFSPKARQLALTCLLLFYFLSTQSQTTIAVWNFEDKNPVVDAGITVNLNCEITTNSTGTVGYPVQSYSPGFASTNNTQWKDGKDLKYWQISISTVGYGHLKLSSNQQSSNSGPRDFKIQLSIDGSSWSDPGIEILVLNNPTTGVLIDVPLPSTCDNQPILFIRWLMTTNTSVTGTAINIAGTSRIDDILIQGCLLPVLTSSISHSCCSGSPVNYIPEGSASNYEWNRLAQEGIAEVANMGFGTITESLTNTTNLPVVVNFTYNMDLDGCTNSQTVEVTVNPTPDLLVSPTSMNVCPEPGSQMINFSNPNQVSGTTFQWEWTGLNSDLLSLTPSNGNTSPIIFSIVNNTPSVINETSIDISGTSPQGCSTNQLVTIRSGDNTPPTFLEAVANKNLCVQDIIEATSNGSDDIAELRPDYYALTPLDNVLDLDPVIFIDNCTPSNELIIHWQLDLDQNPVSVTGIGQPSLTDTGIILPGNTINAVNHNITYWLEDKYGNLTSVGQRPVVTITIRPRPPIVRDF